MKTSTLLMMCVLLPAVACAQDTNQMTDSEAAGETASGDWSEDRFGCTGSPETGTETEPVVVKVTQNTGNPLFLSVDKLFVCVTPGSVIEFTFGTNLDNEAAATVGKSPLANIWLIGAKPTGGNSLRITANANPGNYPYNVLVTNRFPLDPIVGVRDDGGVLRELPDEPYLPLEAIPVRTISIPR